MEVIKHRSITIIILFLLINLSIFSCIDKSKPNSKKENETKNKQTSIVELDTIVDFFILQKQKISIKLKKEISQIDKKISQLKKKNDRTQRKIKNEINEEITELQFRKTEFKKALNELEQITKKNWSHYKKNTEILIEKFEKRFINYPKDESCNESDSVP